MEKVDFQPLHKINRFNARPPVQTPRICFDFSQAKFLFKMSIYSKAEVAKILSDCEILFLNDDETQELTSVSSIKQKKAVWPANENEISNRKEEEDFERIFYASKLKKQIVEVS